MKSKLRIALLAMLVIVCNIATFSWAADEKVSMTASKKDVKSGDTFEITISQESTGVVGFESTLNYDTNLFTLTKVENGTGWRDMGNQTTKFDAISDNAITSGNIFKLTFTVKENVSAKTSEIKLSGIKLYRTSTDKVDIEGKSVSINIAGQGSSNNNDELKGITLNKTNLTLALNIATKMQLSANANPITATLPEIVWSTSNDKVVAIEKTEFNDSVILSSVGVGNATITAKTKDGKYSATCQVTVNASGNVSGDTQNGGNNSNGTTSQENSIKADNVSANSDDTIKAGILPKTGSKTKSVLLVVAGLAGVGIISYIGYRKYKEI